MIQTPRKGLCRRSIFAVSIIIVFCGSVGTLVAGENRIIHFPKDCSIGGLYVVDPVYPTDDFWAWLFAWETKWLGEARGDVKAPADKWLRLDVSEKAWSRPKPFAGLKPNDIQILNFFTYRDADASVLEDGKQLTGLEVLNLAHAEMIETGLENVVGLRKLKYLYLPGHIRELELAHLSKLPSLEFLYMAGPMVTDAKMAHIGRITSLKQLSLTGSEVGNGLAQLKGLKSLRYLNLEGNRSYDIDDGLAHLAGLMEMRELILQATQVSDAGLAHLKGMRKLEKLDLRNTRIGDAGLAHLRAMTKLKELYLRKNPHTDEITDAGMAHIKELKSLEELVLPYMGITDAGLAQLVALDSLKKLDAFGDGITDKGLAELAKMKSLEGLGIRSDNITDAGMASLSEFVRLKALELNDCAITDVGIAELAKLKLLTKLSITKTQVSGDGLAVLKELPLLMELNLLFMTLGQTGLGHLEGLPSLEKLWLAYPDINMGDKELAVLSSLTSLKELDVRLLKENITEPFTDRGFSHLSKLGSLRRLQLSGNTKLTDAGLNTLSNLTGLENIHLYQCERITDAGLKHLEGLTSLKWLYLGDSRVTEEGMLGLKKKILGLSYRL